MTQLRDFRRDGLKGIMVKVEVDKECEAEEARRWREILDVDSSHVQ